MKNYHLIDVEYASFRLADAARDLAIAWAKQNDTWVGFGIDSVRAAMAHLGYTLTPISAAPPAPAVSMVSEDDRPVTFATTPNGNR